MRHSRPILLALALTAGFCCAARADSPRVEPLRQPSMQQYGAANADCAEWSNACQTCKRDAGGIAQCSTPGIACAPGAIVCKSRK